MDGWIRGYTDCEKAVTEIKQSMLINGKRYETGGDYNAENDASIDVRFLLVRRALRLVKHYLLDFQNKDAKKLEDTKYKGLNIKWWDWITEE